MKYTMAKTQQFGDHHFKKGERVFVRPIHGTNNVILSRMKHQPNGHTVSRDWLRELVVAEPTEPQQVIETTTVAGKAPHTFRHVGSVELNGRRVRAYLLDALTQESIAEHCREVTMRAQEETGRMPDAVTLTYYRSQEQYDELGRDEGWYGVANANARAVAAELKRYGFSVEFRYPDDGALRTPGSRY